MAIPACARLGALMPAANHLPKKPYSSAGRKCLLLLSLLSAMARPTIRCFWATGRFSQDANAQLEIPEEILLIVDGAMF